MESIMKKITLIPLLTLFFVIMTPIYAVNIPTMKPLYNKIYRTGKIADLYHFLLLDKSGRYYYIRTNKSKILTTSEIKSPSILKILNSKQSWGQAFSSTGKYIIKNSKIYTKRYLDKIQVNSSKEIKYLNKTFHLQQ
jgi:hypothetical protein